jgi:hypothetical protein
MSEQLNLLIAKSKLDLFLKADMANRHGLIAGATGTGKTVTLMVLAEAFSEIGVPVFLADVKGDLSGMSEPGEAKPKITERIEKMGLENFEFKASPVRFWDVFGKQGHPVRTTISEMGPLLLSRLLSLNDTQSAILNLVFRIADDNGMLLLDLKDLKAMLQFVGDNASSYTTQYGNISKASIGAIQRGLLVLEEQKASYFFGEPALDIRDLMMTNQQGRGVVNILAASELFQNPSLYSTFLLWLLSELFEELPEVGDLEKPKMIFFFDEAHLLFYDAPKIVLDKIEQVVRLIRSKGVGVYFITQNPIDIPDRVLGQLGNRVQHALRAYTPRDQKAVKAAAETFRVNPEVNVETAILDLGVGEALVSFLDEKGRPSVVERALIVPPKSMIGPIEDQKRQRLIDTSPLFGRYEDPVDRESAYEILVTRAKRAEEESKQKAAFDKEMEDKRKAFDEEERRRKNESTRSTQSRQSSTQRRGTSTRTTDTAMEKMAKSMMTSMGRQIGSTLVRGVLGSLMKGK